MTKRKTTDIVGFPVKRYSKKEPILPESIVTQNLPILRGWEKFCQLFVSNPDALKETFQYLHDGLFVAAGR
jgi:hypothetical protein